VSGSGPRRLAIIAGAGDLPLHLGNKARQAGVDVFFALVSGSAREADYTGFASTTFGLGQLGRFLKELKARDIEDVIILGAVVRPALSDLVPDLGLVRHYFAIKNAFKGGDDHLLVGLVRLLEGQGLCVRGPWEFAPDLVAKEGALTKIRPGKRANAEILKGSSLLEALSPFDMGQAVVVADNRIVAVEGIEGTDRMLARVAALRKSGRLKRNAGGVLVKLPKRGQDLRVDMPTIGTGTVERAAAAGLSGIAIAAGAVLLADPVATRARAETCGLFLQAVAWP
jgi:UDP-2,3-diacylglucosamine hydrolase